MASSTGSGASFNGLASSGDLGRWGGGGARPPAPMGLSTHMGNSREGEVSWNFRNESDRQDASRPTMRVGSSDRFTKQKETSANDSLKGIMDVLSQMDGGSGGGRRNSRSRDNR